MAIKLDDLLPKAGDYMKKLALSEAEEASKEAAKMAAAEAEKQALIDRLTKPSGVSDEDAIQRAVKIIERAVANGKSEVDLRSGLANRLTATRSAPEALQAYQECVTQRMQMAADDGRRLFEECQKVSQKVTGALSNGWPKASS